MTIRKIKTTTTPEWTDGTNVYRGEIEYGMTFMYLMSDPAAQPYFSINGQKWRLADSPSFAWTPEHEKGNHEEVILRRPEFAELLQFNLWRQDGLPDDYMERNRSYYCWYAGLSKPWGVKRLSYVERMVYWNRFRERTLLTCEKERPTITNLKDIDLIDKWLEGRKEMLQSKFYDTMKRFGVEYITEKEMSV